MTLTIGQPAKNPTPGTAFLAFNSQLPLVAAKAAVELERHRKGQSTDFTHVRELSDIISGEIAPCTNVPSNQKRLHDPLGASVLRQAYISSHKVTIDATALASLHEATISVAEQLRDIGEHKTQLTDKSLLELRDFCLSLAEFSAMSRKLVTDERPKHPRQKVR